ncbi:hypothetical protein ACG74X_19560 [Marivita sp. S0852]|uniref:hypothetical protein n=1 Tax=Marivita sp. S0852 TaxID=3373893 RepID=UPI003981AD48
MTDPSLADALPEVLTEAFGDRLLHAALTGSHAMGFDNRHSDVDVVAICRATRETPAEGYRALRCGDRTVETWVLTPDALDQIETQARREVPTVGAIRRAGKIAHGVPVVHTTASAALMWDADRIAALRLPAHRGFKTVALNEYWDLAGARQASDISYGVEAANRLVGSELNALLVLLGDLTAKRKRFAARLLRAAPEAAVLARCYDRHITLTEGSPPPRAETRLARVIGLLAHVQCLSAALALGRELSATAWARPDGLPVAGPICLFASERACFALSEGGSLSVASSTLGAFLDSVLSPATGPAAPPTPDVRALATHLGLPLPSLGPAPLPEITQ